MTGTDTNLLPTDSLLIFPGTGQLQFLFPVSGKEKKRVTSYNLALSGVYVERVIVVNEIKQRKERKKDGTGIYAEKEK